MISNYFVRPGLELDLKNKINYTLYSHNISNAVINVEGRDVVLNGVVANLLTAKQLESEIQNISGINQVKNMLVVEKLQ